MSPRGRTSSVDFRFVEHYDAGAGRPLQQAFDKLARRNKSITAISDEKVEVAASPKYEKQELVWRDRDDGSLKTGRWRNRKTLVYSGILLSLVCVAFSQNLLTSSASSIFNSIRSSPTSQCNPFAVPGKFHVDYSEPSSNYWEPKDPTCTAPRYVSKLRSGDFESLEWMQGKTVVLVGDSIERDHVALFCSLMGKEAEVVKANHRYSVQADSVESSRATDMKKKDRYSRIAFKGMQESTLPRVCHLEDLDFMLVNLYHFGLDQKDYWKNLDQYHAPGSIEDRFDAQILPFIAKLKEDGREVDMVEIGTGMYDLAKWAKEDVADLRSTEEPLTTERLVWYQTRIQRFVELASNAFPTAIKTWRGVTIAQDQAAELDYFNDRFGHSPASVTPHFAPGRARQLDAEARKFINPYNPALAAKASAELRKRGNSAGIEGLPPKIKQGISYNTWSTLVEDVPSHQLDRLHGGDLATPGAVLWSDIMLWHLEQGTIAQEDIRPYY